MKKTSDLRRFGIAFLITIFILKSLFFEEGLLVVLKVAAGFYWLLVIPGIGLTYLWDDITFEERFALGVAVSAALVGILSYYLGLLGISVWYSSLFLPPLLFLASAVVVRRYGSV